MTYLPPKNIRCVAHRGDSEHCPENTRASFISALAAGAHAIELDIQMSSDKQVFVFHDNDFSRMGKASAANYQTPYSEIGKRDIGSWFDPKFKAERTITIEDLFTWLIPEITLLIEIKTWLQYTEYRDYYFNILLSLARQAERTEGWKRFEVLCYDKDILLAAKEMDPRFRCVLNTDNPIPKDALAEIKNLGIDVISTYIENLNKEFSDNIHITGFPHYVFTCNNEAQVRKAVDLGADTIMSDDPVWLKNLIDRNENEKK